MRPLTSLTRTAPWIISTALAALLLGCESDDGGTGLPTSSPIAAITFDAVFVLNGGDGTISVLNADTQETAGVIRLSGVDYIHHAYLSPDRTRLTVSAPGYDLSMGHGGGQMHHGVQGSVMVMDARTGEMMAACQLPAPNHNVAPSPDGTELWTSQMSMPGSVLVLDAQSLAILAEIPVGDMPSEVTFTADGARVFVANTGSNSVTVVDAASRAVIGTYPVEEEPVGAWPGGNGMMYVDNEHSMTLTVMDAATMAVHHTCQLGFMPGMAALAPNGELWVTDAENGQVVFYDALADLRLGQTPTGAGAHAIAFDEASRAYISNQDAGTVSVVDVATHALLRTMPVGSTPNGLCFRSHD